MVSARAWGIVASLLVALISTAFLLPSSSANPNTGLPPMFDTTFSVESGIAGFVWLILLNILVNLFWVCAIVLILGRVYSRSIGTLVDTPAMFLTMILGCATAITVMGAAVDYALLLQPDPGDPSGIRYFAYDAAYWSLALVLIFVSVFVCFLFVLGIRPVLSLISAGVMVGMNITWWVLSWEFGYDVPLLMIVFGGFAVPILLRSLFFWFVDVKSLSVEATPG